MLAPDGTCGIWTHDSWIFGFLRLGPYSLRHRGGHGDYDDDDDVYDDDGGGGGDGDNIRGTILYI